jgi:hypothetical protein
MTAAKISAVGDAIMLVGMTSEDFDKHGGPALIVADSIYRDKQELLVPLTPDAWIELGVEMIALGHRLKAATA